MPLEVTHGLVRETLLLRDLEKKCQTVSGAEEAPLPLEVEHGLVRETLAGLGKKMSSS